MLRGKDKRQRSVRQNVFFRRGVHQSEYGEQEDSTYEEIAYAVQYDCGCCGGGIWCWVWKEEELGRRKRRVKSSERCW